jgi:hypothetical protein
VPEHRLVLTLRLFTRPPQQEVRMIKTRVVAAVIGALAIATPALAGPPLLCHPFDIGNAKSLPWLGQKSWDEGQPGYRLDQLVADTEALLTPSTPVIVRMETLRRAALYASTDARVAGVLVKRIISRAEASEIAGRPDALAYLDAAYIAGAFNEITMMGRARDWEQRSRNADEVKGKLDAYGLISKSVALRPSDPAIQFAAALISTDSHRGEYPGHAAKARVGADNDALLARNLAHVQ